MPSVTTSDIVVDLVRPFDWPVTLIEYVPVGVTVPVFEVVIVRVVDEPVASDGSSVAVAPAGRPVTVRATGSVKNVRLTEIAKLAVAPCFTEPEPLTEAADDSENVAP